MMGVSRLLQRGERWGVEMTAQGGSRSLIGHQSWHAETFTEALAGRHDGLRQLDDLDTFANALQIIALSLASVTFFLHLVGSAEEGLPLRAQLSPAAVQRRVLRSIHRSHEKPGELISASE